MDDAASEEPDVKTAATLGRRAPAQRRVAVVTAARDLFLAQGVEATSVDAIARRAGVAKGTVYLSFPTKQHLVRAIEEEFDALILDRLRSATSTAPPDAATAAAMWCTALVEASLDNLEVHDFLFYGRSARVAERTVDATLSDDLAGVLRDRGVTDAEEVAVFLIGGVTALTDLAVLRDSDRTELSARVERLVSAALHA
ncbi:transcriptional regulator [Microbacterium testaceum StLB037]|uniref:Transcriptional regulator n=1 Tax=Microbacterium testaceum (strain StLB037) TaxID=979556 RepID=E8NDN1_MICTS|nr:TetR/AcrR family transcriptional regulator [Microbacterium testaceum]BAJ73707.1 transcriptional regulator [Microbacterium testaceum StLB037]